VTKLRVSVPEAVRLDVIARTNNRCCVCQTPFVQIHHVDSDPCNNDPDNLAPLCPNCHNQAHGRMATTVTLNASRVKALRDGWYKYCERRRDGSNVGPNAVLKLKNFVRSVGFANYGWKKTFASIDLAYKSMNRDDIIDHVFSTTNRDDLVTYLETVKCMYDIPRQLDEVVRRFEEVCNAFGIGYEELR
jgi:hypothetical protein